MFNGVVLPDYVDLSGVWNETVALADAGVVGGRDYTAKSGYIDFVHIVRFTYVADGTAGNRSVVVRIFTDAGLAIGIYPVNTVVTAGQVENYTYDVGAGSPYGPVGRSSVIPLPAIALYPKYTCNIVTDGFSGAGDTLQSISINVDHVPTGSSAPEYESPPPTPLIFV